MAGEIYRQLNHRFGTTINLQVASTLDDEEKEDADQEAADADANGDDVTETTNGETTKATTATTTPVTTPVAPAAKTATPEPRNTVKRVLMPLDKKPVEAPGKSTTNSKSTTTVQTPATVPPGGEQRPRRIQP